MYSCYHHYCVVVEQVGRGVAAVYLAVAMTAGATAAAYRVSVKTLPQCRCNKDGSGALFVCNFVRRTTASERVRRPASSFSHYQFTKPPLADFAASHGTRRPPGRLKVYYRSTVLPIGYHWVLRHATTRHTSPFSARIRTLGSGPARRASLGRRTRPDRAKSSGSGSGMFYIRLRPSTAIGCGTKQ
jgi:hypothetical protein